MQKKEKKIPKYLCTLINQIYNIEKKLSKTEDSKNISRNIEKMKDALSSNIDPIEPDIGIIYEDPDGQIFDETRTDLECHIEGNDTENLVVIDVIKPIIRVVNKNNNTSNVVQKGTVIVKSKIQNEGEQE